MNITRDQAICMLFYAKYSDENVQKYKKKIEDFEEVDICYNVDEHKPILASKLSIFGDPFTYKTYLEAESSSNLDQSKNEKKRIIQELQTESQVKRFINEVYCCEELRMQKFIVNCQFLPKIFMTQLCSILQYLRDEPLNHSDQVFEQERQCCKRNSRQRFICHDVESELRK